MLSRDASSSLTFSRRFFPPSFSGDINSLLNRPLHSLVRDKEGHTPVEDLAAGAAGGVEDSGAEGAGQGVLTVLGEAVVDNALLGEGA